MSLISKLKGLHNDNSISMHVPGHKNNTIGELSDVIKADYDLTEIPGLDDLHDPVEILSELNTMLAQKAPGYHAQAMVNGTTNGIICSIHAIKERVSHFYIAGDAHKSVYHGVSLINSDYTVIRPEELYELDLDDSCVILTSPSYTGELIKDIEKHVEYIRKNNGLSIIDAAHGAHLSITNNFEASLLKSGADVVIESYHKMLPALTMASVLFTGDSALHQRIMHYINQFETSSPSYLVLASIEYAQQFYNEYDDKEFFQKRGQLIHHLKAAGIDTKEQDDPAKLILNSSEGPYNLEQSLRDSGVYSEMVTDEGVLWCLPLWHEGDRYPFTALLERITKLTPAAFNEGTVMNTDILEGEICVENIVPYPPGVPLVLKGNVITADVIKRIKHYQVNHVKIEGIQYNIYYYMNEAEL
ncbi:lysine decarboxylase [Jeotgalicoccus coquinae]|uniref:Arginine decarboxylase n=1 Tax=Jeotgalicoccus coquinae TaxID=709509 RepID=A0A6V7RRK1_9STAP|nr:hypothetical protein [Jeotgalicoccus coquinae]MBB6423799.1 arginine/lysine/ornithine decarboxylase [Jeotgalicoccus coquinae]GGE24916.1 lysine decarboxylase [Jeotgalicoccus coquinae]CAD2080891.1 Arginine decarboxylase [Jeotgalicoccus coquinae]